MASAYPDSSDSLAKECKEPAYMVEDMQRLQSKFAEEAVSFLLMNAQIFRTFPNGKKEDHNISGCSVTFTPDVGKAIITLGYIYRIDCRRQFRRVRRRIKNAEAFRRYVMDYPIYKTEAYFFNFLAWVAFTFDFAVCFLKEGMEFIDEGAVCLASYPDLEYFHSRGGWGQLLEFGNMMAKVYDRLEIVICRELPTDDRLLPFMKAVETIDREERGQGNKWNLAIPEMRHLKEARRKLSEKYEVISCLDPRRITIGYKVRMKKSPVKPKTLQEVCPAAAELMKKLNVQLSPEKAKIADLVEQLEMTRIAVEMTDRSPQSEDEYESKCLGERDSTKSVFIVSEKVIAKVIKSAKESSETKKKSGLKVYSPSKQRGKLAMNLNEILDKNIELRNFSRVGDDVYAVSPPGCDMNDEATQVIVVETSSEEEDEDSNLNIDIGKQIEKALKMTIARCISHQNENLRKMLEHCTRKSATESEVLDSYLPDEYRSPKKSSRAVPRVKAHAPPPPTDEDSSKETLTSPSGSSNLNTGAIPKQSPRKKSPRRRRKSKK